MSIIFKITAGETLSKNDAKFLELWKNTCKTGTTESLIPTSEFRPTFKELNQDTIKQLASIGFEYDSKFDDYIVSDLIFELAEMINDELIDQFELGLQSKHIQETFAVDPAVIRLTKGYYSNRKKQLVDGVEETEWQKSMMFSPKDIDNILALMKVGRGSQAKDIAKWEKDRQSLLDFIASINHHEDRWELLFKWLARKGVEMSKRTNTPVSPLTKSDNELRQIFQKNGKIRQSALLERIFGQPYDKIRTEQLVTFTKNLSRRLYLLSKFFPPLLATIVKEVLRHPNLPVIDRTSLVEGLGLFHINLDVFDEKEPLFSHPVTVLSDPEHHLNNLGLFDDMAALAREFQLAELSLPCVFSEAAESLKDHQRKRTGGGQFDV